MKLKSYNILFRIFSILSDKTNGAPFFVKYKLLLGTLILGLASASAQAQKKEVAADTIQPLPILTQITCYKPTMPPKHLPSIPDSMKVKGEAVVVGSKSVKKNNNMISCYAVTVIKGDFLDVKPEAKIQIDKSKVLSDNELTGIMCYGIVVNSYHNDDIYTPTSGERKFSYYQVNVKPISPVGNLNDFQGWVQSNIRYSKQMLKDKVEGEVVLSFVVDKKGKVVDKRVVTKLSKDANKEALRAVSLSGGWKPGLLYGHPVKTTITITVKFNYKEE